jgi:putative addiction module CopG family antidote
MRCTQAPHAHDAGGVRLFWTTSSEDYDNRGIMQITLKPELKVFVEEQVKSGNYPSVDAVVEAALLNIRDGFELDDETIDAINEGEAQADRGEVIDLDEFRAQWKQRLSSHE